MRRFTAVVAAAALSLAWTSTVGAQEWLPSAWLITPVFADSPALLIGTGLRLPREGAEWMGGGLLRLGVVDYGGGNRYLEVDGELSLTRAWWRFDEVGFGCRFEYWGDANYDFGPMVLLALEEPLGASAVSIYGSASWMPVGVMGDYDAEQLNAEVGLSWTGWGWYGRLGYRRKFYYASDQDLEYGGPVIALSYTFE